LLTGKLYDGVTAVPHEVRVVIARAGLDLSRDTGWEDSIPADRLKRVDADASTLRLGHKDNLGWRLLLPAEAEEEIAALLGRRERYGRWIDRVGLVPALAGFAILAAGIVGTGYAAPQWIAPHVPTSWERNLGSAIVGDFGERRCRSAEGQRALEALVERVAPGATRGPDAIKVAALDVGIFNAAALPGGHVVVFNPAITETDPDALAGIIAHEVAHVRRRHVTEALIRELGIGALIRLFAGDVGANAEQVVALSYTRENEAEADDDAIAMLRKAGISPRPTAQLFGKLSREEGEGSGYLVEFLESHPQSAGRARNFAASFDPQARYRPALDRAQKAALVRVCGKPGKTVKQS
jgi:Zn-dependent protease with chaperone function